MRINSAAAATFTLQLFICASLPACLRARVVVPLLFETLPLHRATRCLPDRVRAAMSHAELNPSLPREKSWKYAGRDSSLTSAEDLFVISLLKRRGSSFPYDLFTFIFFGENHRSRSECAANKTATSLAKQRGAYNLKDWFLSPPPPAQKKRKLQMFSLQSLIPQPESVPAFATEESRVLMLIIIAFKGSGSASGSWCLEISKTFHLKQTLRSTFTGAWNGNCSSVSKRSHSHLSGIAAASKRREPWHSLSGATLQNADAIV